MASHILHRRAMNMMVRSPFCSFVSPPSSTQFCFNKGAFFASSSSSSTTPNPNRTAALLTAIKQIEHSFGKNAVMQLGQKTSMGVKADVIPSGSLGLDLALGIGGFPRGRVVEIYGPESSGKTTLALHVIAEGQKKGLTCVFVDAEHALDSNYAKALSINLDALYISQPDDGEQALEITDNLVRSGAVDVIVIDSVAALTPRAELSGEMGDSHMALQARLMSQALRKLTASLSKSKTLIIFLNQIRSKVGVIFGSPDVTTGGNALKFFSSIRCEIRRTSVIKDKADAEVSIGNMVKVKISKNKMAPPFTFAEFEMSYGKGISRAGEAIDLGVSNGVLKRSGAYYTIADEGVVIAANAALAKEALTSSSGGGGGAVVAAAAAAPATTAATGKGKKKGKGLLKGKAAAAAAVEAAEAAEVEQATSASTTTSSSTSGVAAPTTTTTTTTVITLSTSAPFSQGREKAKQFLEMHPAVLELVYEATRKAMIQQPHQAAAAAGGSTHRSTSSGSGSAVIENEESLL